MVIRVRDDRRLDVCRHDTCTYRAHVKLGIVVERELQCTCPEGRQAPTCGVHGILSRVR